MGYITSNDRYKREEVEGGWRKLHNVESHNLYILTSLLTP